MRARVEKVDVLGWNKSAEGHIHNMMEAILYYKKDTSVVNKNDMYMTTKSGQRRIQKQPWDGRYWFSGRTEPRNESL